MSLIFEALKKLDREKKAPERGFLVVGGAPLPGRRLHVPALLLLLAAAGGGGFLLARTTRPAPTALAPVASTTPTERLTVPRLAPPAPLPPETTVAQAPAPATATATTAGNALPAASAPSAAAPADPAPAASATAPPAFALQAVADQEGQPVAIVNGQLVRVGDLVDGARVVRIAPEEVELEQAGRRLLLTF